MVLTGPGRASGDSGPRRAPLPRLSEARELSAVLKSVQAVCLGYAALSDSSVSSAALNFYESVFILDLIMFNIFFELYILYFTDFWPGLYNILVSYVGPFLEGSKLKRNIFKIHICRYMDKVWQADNICNIVV